MLDLLLTVALLVFVLLMLVITGVVMIVSEVARLISTMASLTFDYVMAVLDWIDDIDWLDMFASVVVTLLYIVLAPFALLKWTYDGILAGVYYAATGLNKLIGGKEPEPEGEVEEEEDNITIPEITIPERSTSSVRIITIDGTPVRIYQYYYDNTCVTVEYLSKAMSEFLEPIRGQGKTCQQSEYSFVVEYRNKHNTLGI